MPVKLRKLAPEAPEPNGNSVESPLFTIPQAAAYARTKVYTIRRLIRKKEIKSIKTLGKGFKIRKSELDAYFSRVEFLLPPDYDRFAEGGRRKKKRSSDDGPRRLQKC